MVIDGKGIAAKIVARLKTLPQPRKFFGAALVGDDPASINFLKQKERTAKDLGVEFRLYQLPANLSTDDLRAEIGRLAQPKNCGGFIVQLPLPEKINRHYVLNAIPKEKDADCLSEASLGAFYTERGKIVPPSVAAVEEILKSEKRNLRTLKVVMVGAGFLIGKPIGFWLQNKVSELVVLDINVKNIHEKLADADIVISGAGHAHLFGAKHLKDGAVIIDFGFNRTAEGKIVGDFEPGDKRPALRQRLRPAAPERQRGEQATSDKDFDYTPTPGGTGPILVAKLFENFYQLNAD